jgi:hypothetical protein
VSQGTPGNRATGQKTGFLESASEDLWRVPTS